MSSQQLTDRSPRPTPTPHRHGGNVLKVLHIVPSFYPAVCYGGPIHSVLALCKELAFQGCEVRVLTTDANGPGKRMTEREKLTAAIGPLQVSYCRRIGRQMVSPALLVRLRAMVQWCDVVHLTGVYDFTTLPTLIYCRLLSKPVVWSPRGALQRWPGSRRLGAKRTWEAVCRLIGPKALTLHLTSAQEAEESAARLGNIQARVISNGIDIPADVAAEPRTARLELLFVGRLDPKKGLENLLAACSLLDRSSVTAWQLTVAGAGDATYERQLRDLCARLGLAKRVIFRGHLSGEAKRRVFAECHAVIVPSHTENFGLVVAEALAHGRPVIASTGTPWAEIEHRACGYWIDNSPGSLCEGIVRIGNANRTAMGGAGRKWMQEEFSWANRASECRELYEKLAQR